jgi:hypothetical protein
MSFRLAMPGASEGRHRLEGSTLHLDPGKRGPAEDHTFQLRGELLTLTDSKGQTREYRWAGASPWYDMKASLGAPGRSPGGPR